MTKQKNIIIGLLFCFFIISAITLYSASLVFIKDQILTKQIIWYLIGFFIIFITSKVNFTNIFKHTILLYVIGNFILLMLLFFGTEINGSKCWFIIPGIGSIQPSEFMKIILIITNAKIFEWFSKKHPKRTLKDDITLFFIIIGITLLPSALTFLEPDTGMVIIYFIISFVMLFIYGIKKRIFIITGLIAIISIISFLYFYLNFQEQFINIFGTNFFYRIDRLLDWSNKNGMQLTNALASIKSAGLTGFGIGNSPIYIPEAQTVFIFSIFSNNFGYIGTIILLGLIIYFDYILIKYAYNTRNKFIKYVTAGFLAMILYQQIQNIGMNIGLLPITGITLPFISYGGSSLLSYMLFIGIIINYENIKIKNSR